MMNLKDALENRYQFFLQKIGEVNDQYQSS
jgi:hypothetical protein